MKALFWISIGLVLYTYVFYPVILMILASVRQVWQDLRFALNRQDRRSRSPAGALPSVSLVFSAYNEEAVIAEKMRNCAALDFPPEGLEILVGCDGCSDQTAEIARGAGLPNARIFEFPRCGKPQVLNHLVPHALGDIVVFCDATTILEPGAVRSLVRHFSERSVGCVCGEMRLVSSTGGPVTEGLYWRYEVFLKFLESRLNMLVGASGCLYAIRRELYEAIPSQGIIDDFLVAMRIRARGCRLVYDPEAAGYEEAASVRQDFHRHVRIGAGNFHALRFTWRLLSPTAGAVAFSYWSHKVFRWLVPFALCAALLSGLALSVQPFYAASVVAAVGLALMALIGHRLERRNLHSRLFSIPLYFLSMNLALLLGFIRFLNGRQTVIWSRTARTQAGAP